MKYSQKRKKGWNIAQWQSICLAFTLGLNPHHQKGHQNYHLPSTLGLMEEGRAGEGECCGTLSPGHGLAVAIFNSQPLCNKPEDDTLWLSDYPNNGPQGVRVLQESHVRKRKCRKPGPATGDSTTHFIDYLARKWSRDNDGSVVGETPWPGLLLCIFLAFYFNFYFITVWVCGAPSVETRGTFVEWGLSPPWCGP